MGIRTGRRVAPLMLKQRTSRHSSSKLGFQTPQQTRAVGWQPSGGPVTAFSLPRVLLLLTASLLLLSACSNSDFVQGPPPDSEAENEAEIANQLAEDPEGSNDALEINGEPTFRDLSDVAGVDPIDDSAEPPDNPLPPASVPQLTDAEVAINEIDQNSLSPDAVTESLDAVAPVDAAPTANFDQPDGNIRNEIGELQILDQAASLACGHVEVGLTALDEGVRTAAADQVRLAATSIAETTTEGFESWGRLLSEAAADGITPEDASTMIAFISVCAEGGYEI